MKKLLLLLFFSLSLLAQAQYIPEHQDNQLIYDLLDELANDGIIDVNSVVKPYSREFIFNALTQAQSSEQTTSRQKKDIAFYLQEFSLEKGTLPESAYGKIIHNEHSSLNVIEPAYIYQDDLFRCKINPLGGVLVYHNDNGSMYKRWVGAEFKAYIGKHFSIYASFRDMVQPKNLLTNRQHYNVAVKSPFTGVDTAIVQAGYIANEMGGAYKMNGTGGGDYSEMRGGVYYSWKWGHIGLAKDHITFGDAYNGTNILSGNTPSFPLIKFNIKPAKWIELNYMHAWLVSMVEDSTEYYLENTGTKKYLYKRKYMAANMLTIHPIDKLDFSMGNSIIYSEDNIEPAYLIPLMFYKSVDHTLTRDQTENQNSQVFFNVSSRNIKHLHLYGSLFIDEYSYTRLSNAQTNPISYKAGFRLSNYPFKNAALTAEYTQNEIITYKHSISSLDYTSNGYLLGSYLGDNAQELYVALQVKPISRLQLKLSYTDAQKGNDYQYIREDILNIISQPFMKDVVWENKTVSLKGTYEVFNNAYASLQVDFSNITASDVKGPLTTGEFYSKGTDYLNMYTPKYLQGKQTTITVGLNYGF